MENVVFILTNTGTKNTSGGTYRQPIILAIVYLLRGITQGKRLTLTMTNWCLKVQCVALVSNVLDENCYDGDYAYEYNASVHMHHYL